MASKEKTYHQNFIAGVKLLMADQELTSVKEAAGHLGISYMTLYKVMDGTNRPTIEQVILLCEKAGFSADWVLGLSVNAFRNRPEKTPLQVLKESLFSFEKSLPDKDYSPEKGHNKTVNKKTRTTNKVSTAS